MSARKKSWLGIAKAFVKAVEKDANQRKRTQARARASSSYSADIDISDISITVTDDDGNEYVGGMRTMPRNEKYAQAIKGHVAKLAAFYREYGKNYTYEGNENFVSELIHKLYPNADPHTCPYCGVIHDFTAARARKCPDCGKKMVVRQGVFLSEEQVTELDKKIADYYDKAGLANQLKSCIERVQSYTSNHNYGEAFLSIAEGYQNCAAIHNQRHEGGYSAWDLSWRILNGEVLEIATAGASNAKDMIGNGYTAVLFARGMHCLRELKYAETPSAMNKYAKMAMEHFYSYLVALDTVGLTDWQQETAIKNIHVAKILGNVHDGDIRAIHERVLTHSSPKYRQDAFDKTVSVVEEYVFLESDPERLRQYIY